MKQTKAEAVRSLLASGRWVPMGELMIVGGWRYSARLHDLKRRGFAHETRYNKRNGGYEYRRAR